MDEPRFGMDAYAPAEIARRVEQAGVAKARLDAGRTLVLAGLAGAFVGLGAAFYTVVVADSGLAFSLERLLGGLAFCLGLILIVLAGAELFTGNNLIAMAWAGRKLGARELLRHWALVYAGNLAGAAATGAMVVASGVWALDGGRVGEAALAIAAGKAALGWGEAFVRGVLCNALVCLAVWLCFGARSTTDKVVAVVFPVTAFVALGFEHSVANMYFLPVGLMLAGAPGLSEAGPLWAGAAANLAAVTLGNVVGGTLLVAAVYRWVYLRQGAG